MHDAVTGFNTSHETDKGETSAGLIRIVDIQSLKPIAKKSGILVSVALMDISAEFFKVYLFSALSLESLAASTLIHSTTRFIIEPLHFLTNQNAVFISQEFGKIRKQSSVAQNNGEAIIPIYLESLENIGQMIREAWLVGALVCLPSMGILFFIGPILSSLGMQEEICTFVSEYFLAVIPSMPFLLALNVNERFFTAVDQEKWLLPYRGIMIAVSIGLNLLLIPELKATGGGLAVLLETLTGFALTFGFIALKQNFRPFRLCMFNGFSVQRIKNMLTQGVPLTFAMFALTGTNFAISIFIGRLGKLRLAVEQCALQFYGIASTLAHSVNEAGNRLIAQSMGERHYRLMRYYGNVTLLSSSTLFVAISTVYNIIPLQLSTIFLEQNEIDQSEDLLRYTFLLIALARLFAVIQDATALNLAGMEDTFLASMVSLVTTLSIMLPLSAISVFLTNFDVYGINASIIMGILISSSLTMKHWFSQSNRAVSQDNFDAQSETSNVKFAQTNCAGFWWKKKKSAMIRQYLPEDNDDNEESKIYNKIWA